MDWTWIGGILILVILSFFLAILFIPRNDPVPIITQQGFLDSCYTNPCSPEFVCDSLTWTCKLPNDTVCNNGFDCLGTSYCSEVCTQLTNGGFDQPCPCNEGLTCTNGQCKKSGGQTCSSNNQCSSNNCVGSICMDGYSNGSSCNSNSSCESGNCSKLICQPEGITTGDLNSVCNVNSNCNSNECLNKICVSTHGLGTVCGGGFVCSSILECNSGICDFGFDPNDGPVCIGGMSYNNTCKNAVTLGCTNNNQCISGSCNGNPSLSVFTFGQPNFPGLTNMSINPISNSPVLTGTRKILVKSNNNIDTLYFLTPTGILSATYNGSIVSNFTNVYPDLSNSIIDFALNDTTFMVALRLNEDVLYSGSSFSSLQPYNPVLGPGPLGTQYDLFGNPIPITNIDIAGNGDVVITSFTNGYVKPSSSSIWTAATAVGGPYNGQPIQSSSNISFYFDTVENPELPGPAVCPSNGVNQVSCPQTYNLIWSQGGSLQFSGNIAGFTLLYPVARYSLYKANVSVRTSNMISVVNGFNIALTLNGLTELVPYQTSANTLVVASLTRYYVFDLQSCI